MHCSLNTATLTPPGQLVQAIAEELSRISGDPLARLLPAARRLLADALAETEIRAPRTAGRRPSRRREPAAA